MSEPPGPAERPPHDTVTTDPAADAPPGGWGRLYALVLAALAVDLVLLWRLTEHYR